VGNQSIKLKDVKKIIDPSLKNNGQNLPKIQPPDLKNSQAASDNEEKGAEEAPVSPANLMDSVGMSNGMMEKFKQDTTPAAAAAPVIKPETKPQPEQAEGTKAPKSNLKVHTPSVHS
jgi:hypothetical protein